MNYTISIGPHLQVRLLTMPGSAWIKVMFMDDHYVMFDPIKVFWHRDKHGEPAPKAHISASDMELLVARLIAFSDERAKRFSSARLLGDTPDDHLKRTPRCVDRL